MTEQEDRGASRGRREASWRGRGQPVTEPLTLRPELDRLRCEEPECEADGPILISPTCHDVSTFAEYHRGELTITCGECGAHVLTVAVAG